MTTDRGDVRKLRSVENEAVHDRNGLRPGSSLLIGILAVFLGLGAGWSARRIGQPTDEQLIERARSDRAAGRLDAAEGHLRCVSGESPLAAEARAELGFVQLAEGHVEAAEESLRLAVLERLEMQPARDELRWLYFNTFRVREAERLLETWLERTPDDYRSLLDLHFAEFRRQLPREGRPYLEQLESRQPGQLAVLRGLAYCDWQAGAAGSARDRFAQAIDRAPSDVETRLLAAEFSLEQGWSELSRDFLDVSEKGFVAAAEHDDRWWGLRGRLARGGGAAANAVTLLTRAIERRPRESAWWQERGLALRELGRATESAADLEAAVRLERAKADMADLVFSGRLEDPDRATIERMARLCEQRGQRVAQRCWSLWSQLAAGSR